MINIKLIIGPKLVCDVGKKLEQAPVASPIPNISPIQKADDLIGHLASVALNFESGILSHSRIDVVTEVH